MNSRGESNVACFSVLPRPGQGLINSMSRAVDLSTPNELFHIKIHKLPSGNV
jgi:hypothetical protein